MPPYPGSNLAKLLYENQQELIFNNEIVPEGTMSQAVQLRRERGAMYPWGWSIEIAFSADPGDFSFDWAISDTDEPANYVTGTNLFSAPLVPATMNSSFVIRFDAPAITWNKYVALILTTWPNAATVSITAKVTR